MLAALRTKAALMLGRGNPYRIKDQFRLLTDANSKSKLTFGESFGLNKETFISRFTLPESNKCLGHRIGEFVELEVAGKSGPYVPVSRIDDAGFVDFVIKRDSASKDSLSNYLIDMQKGTQVTVKNLRSNWLYEGYEKFVIEGQSKQFRYVGLMVEGAALYHFFSLIEAIATNQDHTSVSLVWYCETPEDFFLLQELDWFVSQRKLALNLIVEHPNKAWLGPIGRITTRHIQNYMPYAKQNTLIMRAGSEPFLKETASLCQQLGFCDIHPVPV